MADTAFADPDAKPDLLPGVVDATSHLHTNKRKRGSLDHDASRPAPAQRSGSGNNTGASFLHANSASGEDGMNQFANSDLSALAQHNNQNGGNANVSDTATAALAHHFSMTVPQATELSFQSQTSGGDNNASFSMNENNAHIGDYGLDALKEGTQQQAGDGSPPSGSAHKPAVGSEEWHRVRRDNHKEVERRRRETINEGINELAKIVPGCEKNKGSILQRAVQFITQLKDNEQQNIEKWTLEKILTEQAIAELSQSCDKLKAECSRAWAEVEIYKRACEQAGIVPEEYKGQSNGEGQGAES